VTSDPKRCEDEKRVEKKYYWQIKEETRRDTGRRDLTQVGSEDGKSPHPPQIEGELRATTEFSLFHHHPCVICTQAIGERFQAETQEKQIYAKKKKIFTNKPKTKK
jgi:hypothetical protein